MLHKLIEAKEKTLKNASYIGKLPCEYIFPKDRRVCLDKLASLVNLSGETLFYPGGGCDAATGFALNKEARKIINVSIGKLYNISEAHDELLMYYNRRSDFNGDIGNAIFNRGHYAHYDVLPKPDDPYQLARPMGRTLLTEMARMYLLDGSLLTDIFPASLCNNELISDENGYCFHLTFSNGNITRTVEVLSCDYSVVSPETEAVNAYVNSQAGLHSALIKAPLNIFNRKISFGYYNFIQAIKNLEGTVVYDLQGLGGRAISPLCLHPQQIDFDKRKHSSFGYSPLVAWTAFSELIPVYEAYQDSPLFPQVRELPE